MKQTACLSAPTNLSRPRTQDGKEVVDAVTGYKKQPLQAGVKKLSSM